MITVWSNTSFPSLPTFAFGGRPKAWHVPESETMRLETFVTSQNSQDLVACCGSFTPATCKAVTTSTALLSLDPANQWQAEMAPFSVELPASDEPSTPNFAGGSVIIDTFHFDETNVQLAPA